MKKLLANKALLALLAGLIGAVALACGNRIGVNNHYSTAYALVPLAVVLYFYYVFFVADGNWMDIRALFSASWIGTIGLASLRLNGYQEQWQDKTWLIFGLAYMMFQVGATAGTLCAKKWYPAVRKRFSQLHIGRLHFAFQPRRLYAVCIVTTLIGLACFIANIFIRGYIPCFSSSPTAYLDFYSKFHIFAVAATAISGLCYYCIRTQPLATWKKATLFLCILYLVFIFPIMVVSRGSFVVSAVSLTVSVFYLEKKRFITLVLCLATIFGVYWACSSLRNYTESQLAEFFEPIGSDLVNKPDETTPGETPTDTESTTPDDASTATGSAGTTVDTADDYTIRISPKMAFLYGYLTVSHDNFNEAVQNNTTYTYGVRQMAPFNVILRSSWLSEKANQSETYLVRPHLNTVNLIGDFYYDFGLWGVIFCMLLWSFLFGLNQGACEAGSNPFVMLILGNSMVPVALCFFSSWLSVFSQWLLWGSVLLFAIACYTKLQPKEKA